MDSHQTFQITINQNSENEKRIPCGVLEYSAQSNEILISQEVTNKFET